MRHLRRLITLTMLVPLALAFSASAQDEPVETGSGGLAELLRFVPDTPEARQSITYSDFRAAEAGRQLEVIPTDYPFFETMSDDARKLWAASIPRSGITMPYYTTLDEMTETMGIDFFQIDRTLSWGIPPNYGLILQGNFDENAISTAHEAREFVKIELEGYPGWCRASGCAAGSRTNLANRVSTDLFGGEAGQQFARVLIDDFFISATNPLFVEDMFVSGIFSSNRLTIDPAYQAAVAALDGEHYLRGATFVPTSTFLYLPYYVSGGWSEEEVRGGENNLPMYELTVFADIATSDSEAAVIGLVYRDEAQAIAAGEIISDRIAASRSTYNNLPWSQIIIDRGATVEEPRVYHHGSRDYYVTLITISEQLNPLEQDITGSYTQSGGMFQLLVRGSTNIDLGWLQPCC